MAKKNANHWDTFMKILNADNTISINVNKDMFGTDVIKVTKTINLRSMILFVNDVVECCFDEDNGRCDYAIKDFAYQYYLIEYYTDLKMPDDMDVGAYLIYGTDLMPSVLAHVNPEQIKAIEGAIQHCLEDMVHEAHSGLRKDVYSLIGKMDDMLNLVVPAAESLDMQKIDNLAENIQKLLTPTKANRQQRRAAKKAKNIIPLSMNAVNTDVQTNPVNAHTSPVDNGGGENNG